MKAKAPRLLVSADGKRAQVAERLSETEIAERVRSGWRLVPFDELPAGPVEWIEDAAEDDR